MTAIYPGIFLARALWADSVSPHHMINLNELELEKIQWQTVICDK